MSEWLPATLLAIRAIAHVLISLRVASYMAGHEATHRKGVGIIAALIVGYNMAQAIWVVLNFSVTELSPDLFWSLGAAVFVLILVISSDGNVAKLIPNKLLERLP